MITITNWSELFENADTRKRQRLGWFLAPSGCDSRGYRRLMRKGERGVVALGAFQALCQALATLPMEARKTGTFLNSDGTGMDLADIWEITRMQVADPRHILDDLVDAGWITIADESLTKNLPPICHQSATNLPPSCRSSPGFVKGEGEGEGEGEAPPTPSEEGDADAEILENFWDAYPQAGRARSSREKVRKAWRRLRNRPTTPELFSALQAWKNSDHWAEGFVKGAHLFLSDRMFESPPKPKRVLGVGFAGASRPQAEPEDGLERGPELAKLFSEIEA